MTNSSFTAAPEPSVIVSPLLAVKSELSRCTPFRYTSTSLPEKASIAPLASAPVNAVWLAVAVYLNNCIAKLVGWSTARPKKRTVITSPLAGAAEKVSVVPCAVYALPIPGSCTTLPIVTISASPLTTLCANVNAVSFPLPVNL